MYLTHKNKMYEDNAKHCNKAKNCVFAGMFLAMYFTGYAVQTENNVR